MPDILHLHGYALKASAILFANFTDAAMGIVITYHQAAEPLDNRIDLGVPYFSISLLLNVFLTFMIVIRLVRHSREVRGALGPLVKPSRLYQTIVTIFVESSALYAVTFILFIGPWAAGSGAQLIFFPILAQVQVRDIFLMRCNLGDRLTHGDGTGNFSASHRPTGRQTESIYERKYWLWGYRCYSFEPG